MTKFGTINIKRTIVLACSSIALVTTSYSSSPAQDRPAKEVFGHVALPNNSAPAVHGSYAKGCQAGAIQLASDGAGWQAMRLSRNRRWGQPQLIGLIEQFASDAQRIGWPGLLVGDISQSRGGPMLFGHASHQIGLDVDIWFTPMPNRQLTTKERDELPFTSMLDKSKFLTVDSKRWSSTHTNLVMQAASYPQVERVFVNPAIKKKLCESWQGDRDLLGKVRPVYGHDEHFHIRIGCPSGSSTCKPQARVAAGDGCDKSLAWWFTKEPWAAPKKDPNKTPVKPKPMMMSDLPNACSTIARTAPISVNGLTSASSNGSPSTPSIPSNFDMIPTQVPIPLARPMNY